MKISIVTPSYNQAEFIERTVESVLSQRGDFELEYLVIDGQSTDDTVDRLQKYTDRIRLISEPDDGQANAINKGLALAGGDLVGWLNSDDVLLDGCLQRVATVFTSEPETEWLYGKVRIIDAGDREIRRLITAYKNLRMSRFSYGRLVQECWISQMGVFWRRSFGERVGPLDESLDYSFDYDLWLRFGRESAGRFLPEYLAAFRWHGASKTSNHYGRQMQESYRLATRHAGDRYRWSLLLHRWLAWRTRVVYRALDSLGRGR